VILGVVLGGRMAGREKDEELEAVWWWWWVGGFCDLEALIKRVTLNNQII
jgi:hypothetical protein